MATIPAKAIVSVEPGVLAAGGLGLALNGIILDDTTRVPIGAVQPFSSAADVETYFGASSDQAAAAAVYFAGFEGSNIKPGRLYFTQYNPAAVAAYLRGGEVASLTLAQLQAIPTGSLSIVMDGYTHAAASITLSAATSYSNAASIINTAINASQPQAATGSASTIATTTLTVGGTITGTWAPGQTISGAGVTLGTKILSQLTGTPGAAGTYLIDTSQTVGSPVAITASATPIVVSYDSTSGAFVATSGVEGTYSTAAFATGTLAAHIFLTEATGAVLSQGAAAAAPAAFMDGIVATTQNWASYTTLFDPDDGSGNAVKLEFALWTSQQNNRWTYVCWDSDVAPTVTVPAVTSLGYLLQQNKYSGTILIYDPNGDNLAAFECGAIASLDFTQRQGRATMAFRSQSGIPASVTNQTVSDNLIANGYNFYGAYATANDGFVFFYPGSVSGSFKWADSYVNQIWMNAQFQLDLMLLLTQVKSVPYTTAGYTMIEASLGSTIQEALNFGAISPGVPLSSLQAAEVKNSAGVDITNALFTLGYYVQISPATAQVRQNRQSPPCTFWYTDAGAVQKINLASIAIQ